jgi:Family of unknown function (DUF5681)
MGKHRNSRKPAGDYAVGYRRPPAASRFQKGRSGNPSGRTKGVKSVQQVLAEGLDRRVTVQENGKPRRMRMRDVIVQGLINAAARQDPKAVAMLFRVMGQDAAGQSQDVELSSLTPDDQAIIQAFLESHREIADGEDDPRPSEPGDAAKSKCENSEDQ